MTVTVRPVPQRVARNGIRPFRPVVPTNNLGPVTVNNWRPPVPEPLPPAPLIGPRGLLGLGVLVLAQIWGLLNKPRGPIFKPDPDAPVVVTMPPQGRYDPNGGNIITRGAISGKISAPGDNGCETSDGAVVYPAQTRTETYPLRNLIQTIGGQTTCGTLNTGYRYGYGTGAGTRSMGGLPALVGDRGWVSMTFAGWTVTPLNPDAPGLRDPIELDDWPGTTEMGPADPVPESPPQLPPLITPLRVPVTTPQPVPEPLPEIAPVTPGPTAPPTVAPGTAPTTRPLQVPGATPLPNGTLPPAPTAVVPTTPPDAHFPVPGAPPVTGNGPRPTPEGIAQELGRLEQKVARLSNPQTDKTGDATDRIGLALKLLGDLIEFFNSITAGGGYELSSPCEVDEAGQPIPVVVNFSGAPTALGVINNKIDAVAQLLQEHKNLRQPICRQTPAVGEPVTVQFVQVD